MSAPTLDDLVRAAQAGDRTAFAAVVEALASDLHAFVAARAPDAESVEEAVQAAFVTAWERLDDYRGGGVFAAWLKGIARNRLREDLRGRRRHVGLAGQADQIWLDACAGALDTDIDAVAELRLRRLSDCLQRLDERARALINARYREGCAVVDLARRLGRSPSQVGMALMRIRHSLLACIEWR